MSYGVWNPEMSMYCTLICTRLESWQYYLYITECISMSQTRICTGFDSREASIIRLLPLIKGLGADVGTCLTYLPSDCGIATAKR